MGTFLKKLWTDEDAFLSAFRDAWAWVCGALFLGAELVNTGIIDMGAAGYYGGMVAKAGVVMIAFQKMRAGLPSRSGITPEQAAVIKQSVGLPTPPPPPGNVTTVEAKL